MNETHWERVQRSIGVLRLQFARRLSNLKEMSEAELAVLLQVLWEEMVAEARVAASAPAVASISQGGVAYYIPKFSALLYEWVTIALRGLPLSYVGLVCAPEVRQFIESYARNAAIAPSALSFALVVTYFMVAYEREGKRTYVVSPGLAEQLRHTELRGLSCEDLRLPFPAVYIDVPVQADLKVWNHDSGWHRLQAIYIVEDPDILGEAQQLDFLELEREAWGLQPGQLLRGWRLMLVGECKDPGNEEMLGDDAVYYYRVALPDGLAVEAAIEQTRANAYRGCADELARVAALDPSESWKQVFAWVMNLMMYVICVEPNAERWMLNKEARQLWERIQKTPKGSPKRKRLHAELQQLDPRWRYSIGQGIVVRRGRERAEAQRGQERGPMAVVSWVAGHWKRVAHGPGRAQRRWQFIAPYRRGPEGISEIWKPHHAE
jgi:hypothetical protein